MGHGRLYEPRHYTNPARNAIIADTMSPPPLPRLSDGRLCIVSAWPPELAALEERLQARLRRRLCLGAVGVGLVEAAAGTARLLGEQRPAALLLVGTAGVYPGYQRDLPPGTVAAIDEMVLLPSALPAKDAYLPDIVPSRVRSSAALRRALCDRGHLPSADVACPLAITASAKAAAAAARVSGCALENLEAFAVARAAALAGIPFAAVLGVSNHVGPDGHRQWRANARRAAAAACESILAFLSKAWP
jgi:futalosine hydrolase